MMATEPEYLVLEFLRDIRADITEARVELRGEFSAKIYSLRADVASDFVNLNGKIDTEIKATREQIVGLRRAG
jgi:hypothetical protein